jgi:phage FluMu protein Com
MDIRKTVEKCYIWNIAFMVLKLRYFGKYMKNTLKILKSAAGKVRKDQLERSCEKCKSITQSQRGKEHHTRDKKRAKWVGYSLRRNRLLKHVISGNRKEGTTRKKT